MVSLVPNVANWRHWNKINPDMLTSCFVVGVTETTFREIT